MARTVLNVAGTHSRSWLLIVAVLVIGCEPGEQAANTSADSAADCPPLPDVAVVSCEDAASDAVEYCNGLPGNPWCEGDQPAYPCQPSEQPSSAGKYRVGCVIDFPHENPAYRCSGPQFCNCVDWYRDDAGNPQWACPL
jgi:hypothetical protein